MALKQFSLPLEKISGYILNLAQNGDTAKKLERKFGLPRDGFRTKFIYTDSEGYRNLEKEIIIGKFLQAQHRIIDFPKLWVETSKGIFVPGERYKRFPKKERELFRALTSQLNLQDLEINVFENIHKINNDEPIRICYKDKFNLDLLFYPPTVKYV